MFHSVKYLQGHEAGWLDARNLCRERCMDLISIETHHEFRMVQDIIRKHQLNSIWTSGRLCNFKGCEAKHLQPRRIKGGYTIVKNEIGFFQGVVVAVFFFF